MFTIPWEFINNNRIYLDNNQTDCEASSQAKHAVTIAVWFASCCRKWGNYAHI